MQVKRTEAKVSQQRIRVEHNLGRKEGTAAEKGRIVPYKVKKKLQEDDVSKSFMKRGLHRANIESLSQPFISIKKRKVKSDCETSALEVWNSILWTDEPEMNRHPNDKKAKA